MRNNLPVLDSLELTALGEFSNYSPGVALSLREQGAPAIYEQICELLVVLDTGKLHAFAAQITSGKTHQNWQMLTRLVLFLLERTAKQASGVAVKPISNEEKALLMRLCELHSPAIWAAKWQQALEQFSLAERLHLDYKQVIITFFHSLTSKEGFQLAA
jgi:hypothetical protein